MLDLPKIYLVNQQLQDRRLPDAYASVRHEMAAFSENNPIITGSEVAIAVGSRGITNLPVIVKAVVDHWKDIGMRPFIFPSMGSHGGSTANGQKDILADLEITEVNMGCPIESSMDVVETGQTKEGTPTFIDKRAFHAGHIWVINRVKWHTDFQGPIESGLVKMIAIGLGKDKGAKACHQWAYQGIPFDNVIHSVAEQLLSTRKILGGLAVLEDAYNNTAQIAAVSALDMWDKERKLLLQVKNWKANIPMELDVLIINEMGKIISGPGMDTKVINRDTFTGNYNSWDNVPWIGRIYTRSLRPESNGNAMGLGLADVIHARVLWDMDLRITRKNALTAQASAAIQIPAFHACTDRKNMTVIASQMTAHTRLQDVRIGWIKNTKELHTIALSDNLKPIIDGMNNLEIVSGPHPMTFTRFGQMAWEPFGRLPQKIWWKRYADRIIRQSRNLFLG